MSKFKKALSWVLVVALTAGVSIAGTMAYLTDEDSAVNVMTVGNVQITQNEQERIDHTNVEVGLQDFTQNQAIVPAADVTGAKTQITVNGYHLNIRTGETYVDKIVSVTNDGVNDAYVRTIFAFPEADEFDTTTDASEQWLHWNGVSDKDTEPANGWMWGNDKSEWPGNANSWDVVENVEINGKKYDIYVATNKNKLASGASTSPSLMGFYLDTRVDYNGTNYTFTDKNGQEWNLGDISSLDILVLSQACQTEGFADAWAALDAVFGDVTKENVQSWFDGKTATNVPAAYTTAGTYTLNRDIVFEDEVGDVVNAQGEGVVVNINDGYYDAGSVYNNCTVWAHAGGTINIYDGVFTADGDTAGQDSSHHYDLIYAGSSKDTKQSYINIYGGTFSVRNNGWLLNEADGKGNITVYGGSFLNWNPSDNESEGANTSFLAEGYSVVTETTEEGTWYHVVKITNESVSYTEAGTYDLNSVIVFTNETGDVVNANGENVVVNIKGGYYDAGSVYNNCTVWAHAGGTINIYDGVFTADGDTADQNSSHHYDLIYAGSSKDTKQSYINIYGGTFSVRNNGWLLNEADGNGNITVYGGSFLNWNPKFNVSEGVGTNFLADGYDIQTKTTEEGTWYHVVKIAN